MERATRTQGIGSLLAVSAVYAVVRLARRARRLLDARFAEGVAAFGLAAHFDGAAVVAQTQDPRSLAAAERRARRWPVTHRPRFELADSLALPDATFDAVTLCGALDGASDAGALLVSLRNAISPDGLVVVAEPATPSGADAIHALALAAGFTRNAAHLGPRVHLFELRR